MKTRRASYLNLAVKRKQLRRSRDRVRRLRGELLERRCLLSADGLLHNIAEPTDVNGDSYVSPLDALLVVNGLNGDIPDAIAEAEAGAPQRFLDVSGDGVLSPLDALIIINDLNDPEGEDGFTLNTPSSATLDDNGQVTFNDIFASNGDDPSMTYQFSMSSFNENSFSSIGTFTLAGTDGLSFINNEGTGGVDITSAFFDATINSFNQAVEGFTFTGNNLGDGNNFFSFNVFDQNRFVTSNVIIINGGTSTTPELTLNIAQATISESGGTTTATVTRNTGISGSLTVDLASSDTSGATVPDDVTIDNGSSIATFTIEGVDDELPDGTQTVTITASAAGFTSGSDSLQVLDNESPINVPPVAMDDNYSTSEDDSLSVSAPGLLNNDTDEMGASLSFSSTPTATDQGASVSINSNGSFTYDPTTSPALQSLRSGSTLRDFFTYSVSDGRFDSDLATVTVTVSGRNDAPTASDVSLNATEDEPGDGTFAGDDIDSDDNADSLTYTILSQPTDGIPTTSGNTGGSFTFDPGNDFQDLPADESRNVTFTYRATDSRDATSSIATVTVAVSGVNDVPTVSDVNVNVTEDGPGNGTFLGDDVDTDDDSSSLSYTILSQPSQGTTTTSGTTGDANFTFDPGNDFQDLSTDESRNVTFTYRARDSREATSNTATATITVTGVNDAPVNTIPDPSTLFNTNTLSFRTGDFEVQDVDASTLEVTLTVGQGTVSLGTTSGLNVNGNNSTSLTATGSISNINNGLGSLVYDPLDSFVGTDTLSFTTSDGQLTDTDTVSITVTPPEVPFAASDFFDVDEDSMATNLDILGNDLRPDPVQDNSLSISQINGQTTEATGQTFTTNNSGTITFLGDSVSYLPASDFFGTDTFTYTIISSPNSGEGPSNGTVQVNVQPINDGPMNSFPGPRSTDEDTSLSFTGGNALSVQDIDAGADGVTVTLTVGNGTINVSTDNAGQVSRNGSGNVSINGTVSQVNNSLGGLTYTPQINFAGLDTLRMTTNDTGNSGGTTGGTPLSDTDTVNITIQPINDGPTIVVPGNQTFITDFDNLLSSVNNNAIQIDDVDAGDDDVQVDLLIGDGALTVGSPSSVQLTSNPDGNNGLRLTGTVNNINDLLNSGLTYRTSTEGNRTLSATVNDFGNSGGVSGNPDAINELSATDNVAVEVLDFVPSNIGGFVFTDINNDSNKGSGETGIEGVKITLVGTTFRNTTVSMDTFTGLNGQYLFPNLEPGNYILGQDQPANLNNGTNSFQSPVVAAGNDQANVAIPIAGNIDSRNNNFAERGLDTPFISMFDLLSSQFNRSGALLSTDGNSTWSQLFSGWEGFSNPRIDLSAMTLTVNDLDGNRDRVINLNEEDAALTGRTHLDRVVSRQQQNRQVIRLSGSAADFGLTSGGEGEDNDLVDVRDIEKAEQYAQAVDNILTALYS